MQTRSRIIVGVAVISFCVPLLAAPPQPEIRTGDATIDKAVELAFFTLTRNTSEKWGTICPTLAPVWSPQYPAWLHPYDNYWMNRVTPYCYEAKAVIWPVRLFARYQSPTGMILWGVHDIGSPEEVQAEFAKMSPEELRQASLASRYLRDHLFIRQVHDLWMFTGDPKLLRELLPHCRKSLQYLFTLKDLDGDGLVESANIIEDIDVAKDGKESDPNSAERFVEQALTFCALEDYAKMCDAVSDAPAAADARAKAARIKTLCNEKYWNEKGYFIFAIDARTHEPLHIEHTSTFANGYAILSGLVDENRAEKMLDYLLSWPFQVPGPILIPPLNDDFSLNAGQKISLRPGVYANGGCGWGRGIMPSVTLACFQRGRSDAALEHIRKMAKAANEAGAFYEYWTWEKYTGATRPGGCRDYSETTSGFLEATINGLFGINPIEPGFAAVRIAPRFPADWPKASIRLPIFNDPSVTYAYAHTAGIVELKLKPGRQRRFEMSVCTWDKPAAEVTIDGKPVEFTKCRLRDLNLCEFSFTADKDGQIQVKVSD